MLEDNNKAFKDSSFWIFWKTYGDHLTAPLILIALIILANGLYANNTLQKEISLNCGWGEEDFKCYCVKSEAMKIKNLMESKFELNFTYDLEGAGLENASKEIQDYINGDHIRSQNNYTFDY